jgi:hypothetical protein
MIKEWKISAGIRMHLLPFVVIAHGDLWWAGRL